jgi:hypothetical protein
MRLVRWFVGVAAFGLVGLSLPLANGIPSGATTVIVPAQVTASNWTVMPNTTKAPSSDEFGSRVSCASSQFCMAVGMASGDFPPTGEFAEEWNGTTWSQSSLPSVPGASVIGLDGVSCVNATLCTAVGSAVAGDVNTPLIEQWNGQAWSVAQFSATGPAGGLNGVSCTGGSYCLATGYAGTTPYAEQWNGSTWTATATPPVPEGMTYGALYGVSCVMPTSCMGVGFGSVGGQQALLAASWNGSTWTAASPASPSGVKYAELDDVSCAGQSFCVADGQSGLTSAPDESNLLETWNGSSWTAATLTPPTGAFATVLNGVSCFSATSCTAVGTAFTTGAYGNDEPSATEAYTWNGQAWQLATTPNSSNSVNQFNAVSCLTDWACVAVGYTSTGAGPNIPFEASAPIARSGYRFVASDGGVFTEPSSAPFLGSLGSTHLNAPIVGMAMMPAGDGYYLVAADGGVFTFGSAQFYGSAGNIHLNKPIVGMAVTPDGGGYWLVASDGGIFTYGDAQFYGSTGNIVLNKPIVGMASTPDGHGYYLVASDGGVFAKGDAVFAGSTGAIVLNKPIVGMAVTTSGGYYLVATDGGIFTFPNTGGPPFLGSTGNLKLNKPVIGMTVVSNGYYLGAADGGIFTFPNTGGPPFLGSQGGTVLNKPIVGIAS